MSNNELLDKFPAERLDPFDGMSVTAEAWREAHDYHRAFQRFQTLLYHGHGIISGLNVRAYDPADSRVIIEPGVVVDPDGRTIVIRKEITFDIRNQMAGLLYLLLSHKESKPRADDQHSSASDFRYIYEEYTIQVVQKIPIGPYIELARIEREKRHSKIENPRSRARPVRNQIDMTHRYLAKAQQGTFSKVGPKGNEVPSDTAQQVDWKAEKESLVTEVEQLTSSLNNLKRDLEKLQKEVTTTSPGESVVTGPKEAPSEMITIAISYLGQTASNNYHRHGRGVTLLSRHLSRATPSRQFTVEDNISLTHPLKPYTLLFLVGEPQFDLNNDEKNVLYNYLRDGGTLFLESCRHQHGQRKPPSDRSFDALMRSLGVQFRPLQPAHSLLEEPYLFAAPPTGFANWAQAVVQVDQRVILSMADYGCLWGGTQHGRLPSREDVRAAMEWGSNIIEYAVNRRQSHGAVAEGVES